MSEIAAKLESQLGRRIALHESLTTHTTLQQNTIAQYYLEVDTIDSLVQAVNAARTLGLPLFILGSGSFISLPDETILGLVIKNNCRRFDKISMKGKIQGQEVGVEEVLVQAESGTLMNQLVRFTIEEGLSGLEYFLGLPGTVGGALYTDVKYKNYAVRDCLKALRVLNAEGKIEMLTQDFNRGLSDGILLSAVFQLKPMDKKLLWERGSEAGESRNKNN
ncbi:MAG TPA: FAD-binding protein [Patescibacteria group bacterium]